MLVSEKNVLLGCSRCVLMHCSVYHIVSCGVVFDGGGPACHIGHVKPPLILILIDYFVL